MNGQWKGTEKYDTIIDPLNGEGFIKVPVTSTDEELKEFQDSKNFSQTLKVHINMHFCRYKYRLFFEAILTHIDFFSLLILFFFVFLMKFNFLGLLKCPAYGLHNPLFKPERYSVYGEVAFKAVAALRDPEIHNFFVKAIQRVCPKSVGQAEYEVLSVRNFLQNISGDSPAYIARGTTTAGIRTGQ